MKHGYSIQSEHWVFMPDAAFRLIRNGSGLRNWDFLPILQPANRYFLRHVTLKQKNQYHRKDVRFMSLRRPEVLPA